MTSHADAAFNSIAKGDEAGQIDWQANLYSRAQALALLAIWSTLDDILEVLDTGELK